MKGFDISKLSTSSKTTPAEGFDISKIKTAGQPISTEQALTGEYMTEQPVNAPANAEIEKNEYVKDPSGAISKAEGEKHEKGGIKVNLEDGTEILSDSLKLSSANVKYLSRVFDIDLSTKDTYAKAVDKYTKKIGLAKLNSEQEDLFATMKKEIEKVATDPNTKKLNNDYLSAKIYEVEKKKEPLKQERKRFFDYLFDLQEASKPEEATNQHFKYGGVSKEEFEGMLQKHGISYEEGIKMLGKMPKYKDGDKVKLRGTYSDNEYKGEERVYQKANKTNYGTEKDPQTILTNLYKNFPDIISDEEVFGKYLDKDALAKGEIKFKEGIPLNQEQKAVLAFQEKADKRMRASANDIIKNESEFDEATVKKAKEYLTNETFVLDKTKAKTPEEKIRLYDKKMGNFTSGRYSLKLDLVTPEESKILQSKGIYTANQITPEVLAGLSIDSQERVNKLKKIKGVDSDYHINTYTPEAAKEAPKTGGAEPITNKVNPYVRPKNPKFFFQPDQFVLPPNAQSPETMVQNRFGRVDPIRIGIENNLQAQANVRQETSKQLESLPPSQRAAALANILATSGEQENQAIFQTNVANAQNISNAEQFNIGQSDREDIARSQNVLGYEQRALTAQDKTRQDLRNYLDFQSNKSVNNFQNQQRLNLINGMFPDFELDNYGMAVNYDPSRQWSVEDRDKALRMNMPAYTSPVATNNQNT